MQPRWIAWSRLLLTLAVYVLGCQAAWVRKYPCDSSRSSVSGESPFWIDSLRGSFDTFDGSTSLSLSILGVHNESQFTCNDLNLTGLDTELRFHVLGFPVGKVEHFQSQCPLTITEALTPPEGLLFSKYVFTYSFSNTHRLHTLATEIPFKTTDGSEIDCAAVKITPDVGKAAAIAFTYIPAAVVVLVGITSWLKHHNEAEVKVDCRAAWANQGPIWEIILDITDYIRYLQFIFLAGSLTMEYPGFYQPIVSQMAWSSLLYWTGPIDHGFTYTGVEDGMYVSNASYGLEYMVQMLGFPQMPDVMLDAFINMFILVSGLIVILVILCLITSGSGYLPSLTAMLWQGGYVILGVTLSFFSVPLLSYMSYELILIGYLPNYRVTLVALAMVAIICANYLISRYFKQIDLSDTSDVSNQDSQSTGSSKLLHYLDYLPHAIQLAQGIIIGGLQDWGLAQLLMLVGCEVIVMIHTAIQQHARFFISKNAWCAAVRFLSLLLSLTFVCSSNEAIKQWVGYVILCLHGAVIIFGFLLISLWKLSRSAWNRASGNNDLFSEHLIVMPPLNHGSRSFPLGDTSAVSQGKSLNNSLDKRSIDSMASSYRLGSTGPSLEHPEESDNSVIPFSLTPPVGRHYVTDFSSFYRSPRRRNEPLPTTIVCASPASDSVGSPAGLSLSEESYDDSRQTLTSLDILDELLEVPSRPDIDYSVRESDFYYGRLNSDSTSPSTLLSSGNVDENKPSRQPLRPWTHRMVARFKYPKRKEKGFQTQKHYAFAHGRSHTAVHGAADRDRQPSSGYCPAAAPKVLVWSIWTGAIPLDIRDWGLCSSHPGPILEETLWLALDIVAYFPPGESVALMDITGPYKSYTAYIVALIRVYQHAIRVHPSLEAMQDLLPRLDAWVDVMPHFSELNDTHYVLAHKDLHIANIMHDATAACVQSLRSGSMPAAWTYFGDGASLFSSGEYARCDWILAGDC
ncbi:hypothetical protein ABOM_007299 [Aspergillus bombycis]|uniref:Integral membrane protein n=1 Tax=Aspergillus bombycis TaxID=109264 RepID=A0A1F7ZXA0_9EURO|nr:hypothetical protein ABOM_007299 [Aspergillus bombycis]OGM44070.1 hypothetical protein ABOM_007299 [Aspergillus bombycis]